MVQYVENVKNFERTEKNFDHVLFITRRSTTKPNQKEKMSGRHDCCIANDVGVTKEMFDTRSVCCCNYRVIYGIFLFFGYFGAILNWILTYHSIIAVIWDLMYTIGCILGTVGLIYNHYYGLIVMLTIFIFDAIIALLAISIIAQDADVSSIVGEDSDFDDRNTLMLCFLAFAILQTVFAFILIKMIKAIQHHIAMSLTEDVLTHNNSYP